MTDGAGWRLEIKKYPELTNKAAGVLMQTGKTGGKMAVSIRNKGILMQVEAFIRKKKRKN